MIATKYIQNFFDEKDLYFAEWELIDQTGTTNFISNEVVIENIKCANVKEQNKIAEVLRKIDFVNGDVNDFLKHLAGALINN